MAFSHDPNGVPPTGVYARIEDAGVLADCGRFEGALLMLLVAVAATARKRYPRGTPSVKEPKRKMGDREAFTLFLRDEMWRLVREHSDVVEFRGEKRSIEEFLYDFLRCELVHEATVPGEPSSTSHRRPADAVPSRRFPNGLLKAPPGANQRCAVESVRELLCSDRARDGRVLRTHARTWAHPTHETPALQ